MVSTAELRAAVEAHIAAVGAADAEAVAALHAPAGGSARDVIDTMTFDEQGLITAMRAYAG